MRQRLLPPTAGDRHGMPDRVLAPQRGLDSIGPVLRRWLLVILVADCVRLLSLLRNRGEGANSGLSLTRASGTARASARAGAEAAVFPSVGSVDLRVTLPTMAWQRLRGRKFLSDRQKSS